MCAAQNGRQTTRRTVWLYLKVNQKILSFLPENSRQMNDGRANRKIDVVCEAMQNQ